MSIIIPTFNRAHRLGQAIDSVLRQSFTDWEMVVVDDGSTDRTSKTLSPYEGQLIYLRHPTNLGVSAARNTGIRESSAPWIAFLDSDDYWLSEKLTTQVNFLHHHPDARICQTEEIWIRSGRRVNPKKRHQKLSGDIFEPSLELCLVSPSSVLLQRELLNEVGLFDEELPVCEDYDLWLRISCRYPIHLIPEALLVKVGGHPDQLSARFRGMDRFRIRSLVKLIQSGALTDGQLDAAQQAIRKKCLIYGMGCIKRGRREEGNFYLGIPEAIEQGKALNTFPE